MQGTAVVLVVDCRSINQGMYRGNRTAVGCGTRKRKNWEMYKEMFMVRRNTEKNAPFPATYQALPNSAICCTWYAAVWAGLSGFCNKSCFCRALSLYILSVQGNSRITPAHGLGTIISNSLSIPRISTHAHSLGKPPDLCPKSVKISCVETTAFIVEILQIWIQDLLRP